MRKLLIGTGWKMNIGAKETKLYAEHLLPYLKNIDASDADIFALPPFTSLATAAEVFKQSAVRIGGQNMHWEKSGAWTGEISAQMLKEAGCAYVELAHSERLQHFGERYERVNAKVLLALEIGLIPIICLGETADEKAQKSTKEVLTSQIQTALKDISPQQIAQIVFAYEPRWAIGSKDAAPITHIAEQHKLLRSILEALYGSEAAEQTRVIYGGAVNLNNCAEIVEIPDVDGLFIGRAAWNPAGFAEIIEKTCRAYRQK